MGDFYRYAGAERHFQSCAASHRQQTVFELAAPQIIPELSPPVVQPAAAHRNAALERLAIVNRKHVDDPCDAWSFVRDRFGHRYLQGCIDQTIEIDDVIHGLHSDGIGRFQLRMPFEPCFYRGGDFGVVGASVGSAGPKRRATRKAADEDQRGGQSLKSFGRARPRPPSKTARN